MKIRFLGTNGWYDTETGVTVSILIETKEEYIILDAGNGFYKIDEFIKTRKPIYLFISHFHLDHIYGLHTLNKFNFPQGIDVFGPPGFERRLDLIINKPFTIPIRKLKTKIRLHKLGAKTDLSLKFDYKKLFHSSPCYGYRFYLEGKVLTYCTDTGLCKNLFSLAREADLLITECAYKAGQFNEKWPHLNPGAAAKTAKTAKAKKLILVHFDAALYKTLKERKIAQGQARRIFKETYVGLDDMEIDL